MKKSLLALAVAGAVAVPYHTAQAAEVTLSGQATLFLYLSESSETGDSSGDTKTKDSDGLNVNGDTARLNVAVTEDVGFAEAFGNFRFDGDTLSNTGPKHMDEVRVGFKGDFGKVTLGEDSDYAEYGQKAGDIMLENPNTPIAALSYASPNFSGFTFGVNVIADADHSDTSVTDSDGNTSTEYDESGTAAGLNYAADLGTVTLDIGAGVSNVANTYNGSITSGDKTETKKVGTKDENYTSVGVKLGFDPVYIALAQQTEDYTTKPKGGDKEEIEGKKSLDVKVGVNVAAVSAAITHSQGTGFRKLQGDDQGKDGDDMSSTKTRLDLGYALSSNASVDARFESASDEVDTSGTSDSSASFSRVGLTVKF